MESGQRGTFGSSGPSCETADRRCALRRVGEGSAEGAGLELAYEAFQGWCPIWWCDPRSCVDLKSSNVDAIRRVRHASRVHDAPVAPIAPCDPASGSRAGGALRLAG